MMCFAITSGLLGLLLHEWLHGNNIVGEEANLVLTQCLKRFYLFFLYVWSASPLLRVQYGEKLKTLWMWCERIFSLACWKNSHYVWFLFALSASRLLLSFCAVVSWWMFLAHSFICPCLACAPVVFIGYMFTETHITSIKYNSMAHRYTVVSQFKDAVQLLA